MRTMLTALALFVATATMAQAPKHAITHADLWRMKRVGQPAVSPDGAWVVFPVTEPAYDDKEVFRDLWLVPADGSAPPRRLTHTKRAESDAEWSPDGRQIAFATRREDDEQDQIYILDVHDGGEAQRVTSVETGAGSPKWRPDGKAILFVSEVFPGASDAEIKKRAEEAKARKYKARVYESAPIRFWDRWLDETRPTLFVQTLGEGGKARNLLAGTQFAQQAGFGGQLGDDGDNLNAAWTPDGSGIVFGATVNRNECLRDRCAQSGHLRIRSRRRRLRRHRRRLARLPARGRCGTRKALSRERLRRRRHRSRQARSRLLHRARGRREG
jgi:dipeptidyl aminopeptidase/acylaminoacyl peptidase